MRITQRIGEGEEEGKEEKERDPQESFWEVSEEARGTNGTQLGSDLSLQDD